MSKPDFDRGTAKGLPEALGISIRGARRMHRLREFGMESLGPEVLMKKWQQFEQLVAAIHRLLNAADYEVEVDVQVNEPAGATHQIDVLLRPKSAFAGPILISCKAWTDPVGIDHVREWADIVQQTGAAAGVIVGESGFTSGAVDAARTVTRRISLWQPRPLTNLDFAPDADSPNRYVAKVQARLCLAEPRLVEGSVKFDVLRADGCSDGKTSSATFSYQTRDLWYLRDERDRIVGNLWDLFLEKALAATSFVEIAPEEPRFLVLDGIRLRFNRLTFAVEHIIHERKIEIDLLKSAMGYENVVSGMVNIIPLPLLKVPETTR